MGDKHRGKYFSEYIIRNFPKIKTTLCIADGNFITAKELSKKYTVTVFDPFIRARKNNHNIPAYKRCFYSNEKIKSDLIIGMHPDEATGEIIDWAIKNSKPFVICP